MSIILKYKENEFNVDTIAWDRDSFFIDFNNYWERLVGLLSQKIAENTTDNWNKFNLIRTQAIKILGINVETDLLEPSSPINIISTNIFPLLLVSGLQSFLQDKNRESLIDLFQTLLNKALKEVQVYIKDALILKNIELIKKINQNVKQILITNDSRENNEIFLKEAGLANFIYESQTEINKEQLDNFLKSDSIFLTNNEYLKTVQNKRGFNNILLIENFNLLNFSVVDDLVVVHIDGASRGNPGRAGIGIAFYKDRKLIHEVSEFIGERTNNFAEYTALIRALEVTLEKGFKNIEIKSDSELIVNQIKKVYKVKDAYIKELYDKACSLIEKINSFKISHVRREENLMADKLANKAL